MDPNLVNCYFWLEPSDHIKGSVYSFLKSKNDLVILNLSTSQNMMKHHEHTVHGYALMLCRKYGLLKNFYTSFINTKDHFSALQLSLNHAYKNIPGTSVSNPTTCSDVILFHKEYVAQTNTKNLAPCLEFSMNFYQDFLNQSNSVNEWQLSNLIETIPKEDFHNIDFLFIGTTKNSAHKKIVECLARNRVSHKVVVESPLDASIIEDEQVNCHDIKLYRGELNDLLIRHDMTNGPAALLMSNTQAYVREVFVSYLNLLLNSRDELSLGKALSSPFIGMNHDGFIALKHLSALKGMPMCQTAISYVTRMHLGGKSYEPSLKCPLRGFFKELELFVKLLNQLQEILEENSNPLGAIRTMINCLKNRFFKFSNLKSIHVAKASEDFLKIAEEIEEFKTEECHNRLRQKTLNRIRALIDHFSCNTFCEDDLMALTSPSLGFSATPLNILSITQLFRTPDAELKLIPSLVELPKEDEKLNANEMKFKAGLPWGNDSEKENICELITSPAPIYERDHSSSQAKKVAKEEGSTPKRKTHECFKRKILSDVTNGRKKICNKNTKSVKSKQTLKGQKQLTTYLQKV